MRKTLGLAIIFLNAITYFSTGADVKAPITLENSNCTELTIIKFKSVSDNKRTAEITIKDQDAIRELSARIQSFTKTGDKLTEGGPKAERTDLVFQCAGKDPQIIQIIGKRFRLPNNHSLEAEKPIEENLVRDIEALFEPGLNKKILKIKDHLVKFKDFNIKYITSVHTPLDPNGPTIGPTNDMQFEILKDDSSNRLNLSISDGQTPPKPEKFAIGKKIYYLLTYQNLTGERLYPKYFEISEQAPKRD